MWTWQWMPEPSVLLITAGGSFMLWGNASADWWIECVRVSVAVMVRDKHCWCVYITITFGCRAECKIWCLAKKPFTTYAIRTHATVNWRLVLVLWMLHSPVCCEWLLKRRKACSLIFPSRVYFTPLYLHFLWPFSFFLKETIKLTVAEVIVLVRLRVIHHPVVLRLILGLFALPGRLLSSAVFFPKNGRTSLWIDPVWLEG